MNKDKLFSSFSKKTLKIFVLFLILISDLAAESSILSLEKICIGIKNTDPIVRDTYIESLAGREIHDSVRLLSVQKTEGGNYASILRSQYTSKTGITLLLRIELAENDLSRIAESKEIDFKGKISYITPLNSSYTQLSVDIILQEGTITIE